MYWLVFIYIGGIYPIATVTKTDSLVQCELRAKESKFDPDKNKWYCIKE